LLETVAGPGANAGVPEIEIIAGLSLFDAFVPQAFGDMGLDGNLGTTQFSLTFHASGPGSTTITMGGGADLNGVTGGANPLPIDNDSITISVVPEPGAFAASLAGLGTVAGIILLRRRSR
jgi:hypothetical protein